MYKTEKYLKECIDSIINQTLKDIEIIIVDDGSPDGCPLICDDYSKIDDRIVVVHKENGGISSARNAGMEVATGEYIGFVDSDDYVSNDMFEKMYYASLKYNTEIVSCGYYKCDNDGKILSVHSFPIEPKVIEHDLMMDLLSKAHRSCFIWYVCRNIYKRSLLESNKLVFNTSLKFAEDSIFNLYAFYYAKRVVSVEESMYFYRENPSSLTSQKGKFYLERNLMLQYEEKIEFYSQYGFGQKALHDLKRYVVEHQMPMLLQNAFLITDNQYIAKIREIQNMRMIKESLAEYKIADLKLQPIGIKIIIILMKTKQIWLLIWFLNMKLE